MSIHIEDLTVRFKNSVTAIDHAAVSYTHLTLPTNREVSI